MISNNRDKIFLHNVGLGFVAKIFSLIISFIQIPITLSILNKGEYGIWVTIFSVTGWLAFFDVGMGNGFRNQLTEAFAQNDTDKAKKLVSTIYLALSLIFTTILSIFFVASFFITWTQIFNAPPEMESQLYFTVVISVASTAINFVVGLIHIILASKHQTAKSGGILLIGQSLILIFSLIYMHYQNPYDFLIMSTVLSVMPLLVNIITNIVYFQKSFKVISPSFSHYRKNFLRSLMSLGIMFFLIQVSGMVMYATDNFIINKLLGSETVTVYSISYKYFSVISILFAIINAPLWTMYVDAYASGDFFWVKKNLQKMVLVFKGCFLLLIFMVIGAPYIYRIWIGPNFNVPTILNVLISIYILIYVWGNIWVLPLNAAGKIKIQVYLAIIAASINIPLILVLFKFIKGVEAVLLGNIISTAIASAGMYFYYKRIQYLNNHKLAS